MTLLYKALKVSKKVADEVDTYIHNYDGTSVSKLIATLICKYGDNDLIYALFAAGVEQGIRYMISQAKDGK